MHDIDAVPLSDEAIARLLRSTTSAAPLGQREEPFRISLAGAQEKTALLWHDNGWHRPRGTTPTTHILKLPLGPVGEMQADLTTSVENEWLCGRIIAAFDHPVASSELAQFGDQRVLVVERFDRRLAPDRTWWMRLPQEDLCQATATPPSRKYQADGGPGIESVMTLLLGARDAHQDRCAFLRAQILFWLLAAIDGHAKNFSLVLHAGGSFSLAPLYDVLSAHPILGHGSGLLAPQQATMAMAVFGNGKKAHYKWARIRRRHWIETGRRVGLSADAERTIDDLLARTPSVIDAVATQLPAAFPAAVADTIFDGLRRAAGVLAKD